MKAGFVQTGRLFEIIYLLMDRHQMTSSELAKELEVSTRTIRRDIEALSAAGVPVYMTRGKQGGIHLLPNYVLNKSIVSEAEQTEILSALSALRSTGVADDDETHERFARIFQRETIDWIDIDFSFWGAPPEYKQAFETIKEAITSRHLLRFEYYDASGKASIRTVEPARLVFKEVSWYLQAFCLMRNDWRIFKLPRIKWVEMEILEDHFNPKPLPPFVEDHQGDGTTTLRLLFEAQSESRVREEFAPSSITIKKDGRLLVEVESTLSLRTRHYILSYGSDLEVLAPLALRDWVREQALKIANRYPHPDEK